MDWSQALREAASQNWVVKCLQSTQLEEQCWQPPAARVWLTHLRGQLACRRGHSPHGLTFDWAFSSLMRTWSLAGSVITVQGVKRDRGRALLQTLVSAGRMPTPAVLQGSPGQIHHQQISAFSEGSVESRDGLQTCPSWSCVFVPFHRGCSGQL